MNENTMNNDVTMAGVSERALLASRYRIIRQLGQGGMGSVWLAEDTRLDGKLFAIKMLPSILVANKRAYNQLKVEALVAMKLVHPNIVQIRAFEENDGNPFLVMDYIDGETLDDWLGDMGQELGVSEEDVVRLLKPIAEALDYAHSEGVVHRDIKPANVMIRKDGRPFIMDFGIAREIQETMTRVTGKMSSGTLMYMSPEQLNGDVPKPSQDIYSFAAMVYECIKGEPPFCRGNIEFQIMNKEPEPLTYGSSSVPANCPAIADSVMSGLAKNPDDRPKSCVAVLEGAYGNREKESGDREGERPREPQEVWSGQSPLREAKSQEACERPRQPHRGLFGNIAAIILLAFGLVGGIWYWQGTYENEVVSDSLIPAKPSAKANLPPPPSGPTELDMMEIKVESSVQKERIGRIDGADGFKIRKDGLSDLYIKAVAYENAKSWSNAAINYTNYVEGCKALLALNNERNLADKYRKIAEAAKVGAEGADSAKYVSVQWNEALANAKIAGEKFAAMEFAKASHLYEKAAGQFLECELNAKKESERLKKEQEQREVALREKERLAAVAARSFALKESKRAEEEGAKQYAVDSWNRIVIDWKSADDLLKEKRYAEAKNKFDEIAKAYADCIEETQRAKIARERQVLEALATNPGKVLKKDLFTPKLKKYEWIYTEILRVQGELSALLGTFTEEFSEVQEKRKEFNELLEQFVELMEKDGLGDKARKALKSWAGSEGVIKEPSFDEPSYFIYEVKSGDSLARIAQKYQITVTEIIKVNKIRPNRLWVGQKLKIPINKSVSNKSVSKVQLWEGGPYWAAKNIGADKPEDDGYYFWWGDTIGYKREGVYKREGGSWVASDRSMSNFSFSGDNTPTYDKSISDMEREGWIEKKNDTYVLTSKHDAAQAHLGGAWRMPTNDEFDDLISKCDWTWTTRNGKNGYVVRGRGNYASKSIFLPVAGYGYGTSLICYDSSGTYWSSVPLSDSYRAYSLYFYSGYRGTYRNDRFDGRPVRSVQGFTK